MLNYKFRVAAGFLSWLMLATICTFGGVWPADAGIAVSSQTNGTGICYRDETIPK